MIYNTYPKFTKNNKNRKGLFDKKAVNKELAYLLFSYTNTITVQ